jgi:hypothetical protein
VHIVTDRVSPDEPSWGIKEGPVLVTKPDQSTAWHWVQQVFVERGDSIAKFETDFGPEENFETVTPFAMISFGDDTVAELQDAAARNRHDDYWYKYTQELKESSTLMRDIVEQKDKLSQVINNRTVIGPHQRTQRNGYTRVRSR